MLLIYKFIGYAIIPIIKLNIYIRILLNKENKNRYLERFGISSKKKPEGKLIWLHTSSVGELKSITKIIEIFYTKYIILVTTTTLTAANYACKNYKDKIIHQYIPLDISVWVKKFINNWQPSLILWIESDLWPITMNIIKEKNIKSLLINARISPKSYNRWLYFTNFFRKITDNFDEIYAQSKIDKKRLENLTKRKIEYIGNLKLSNKKNNYNKNIYNQLKQKINISKVIMLASTHDGEERLFINFIKNLLKKVKFIKIIIAPRHPQRSQSILEKLNKENINSKIINESENLNEDVFIINSLGEMDLYYSLSDIVVLGGSFSNMGGHNPIEPASNNCVVISGPCIYNWENIYSDMIENNACIICKNANEVEKQIFEILNNNQKINSIKNNAKLFANNNFFESNKLINKINNYLENVKSS